MTERKILSALKKIERAKQCNHQLETVMRLYHLNLSVLRFLAVKLEANDPQKDPKPKHMVNELISQVEKHAYFKTYISKKNLKALKPWLTKTDTYFKTLRIAEPANTKQLIAESEKILAILKISASKIFVSRE